MILPRHTSLVLSRLLSFVDGQGTVMRGYYKARRRLSHAHLSSGKKDNWGRVSPHSTV